ncbi:MAG: hypothetical protein LBG75_00880 [Candidatus Nomurabacteria bacterium]|jgi:hypothetical protein|nr:hypothetical protein [Candidatus Nomurabacteria bacterium]
MKLRLYGLTVAAFTIALLSSAPVSAADATITISNATTSHPVEMIFDEHDIVPGFSSTYEVAIDNRLSSLAMVKLDSTAEDLPAGSDLLKYVTFAVYYNGEQITAGKHLSPGLTDRELICVAPHTRDKLDLKVDFDKSAGNGLQATNFKLLFNFSVSEVQSCAGFDSAPLPPNTGGTVLPPTKEGTTILKTSIGLIVGSLFLTLLFGLLVLFSRKKDDDDKKKPIYTPKRRSGLEIKHEKSH